MTTDLFGKVFMDSDQIHSAAMQRDSDNLGRNLLALAIAAGIGYALHKVSSKKEETPKTEKEIVKDFLKKKVQEILK